jgi:hypothetical protein
MAATGGADGGAGGAEWSDAVDDDTVVPVGHGRRSRPRRGAPPTPAATDAATDGDTVVVGRPGRGRHRAPQRAGDSATGSGRQSGVGAAPPSSVPVSAAARIPSIRVAGLVVVLDRPVVVGRRPAAPRVVNGPDPALVTVPSPTGQVSASHLAVRVEGEAVVVEDLRSTNGTTVRAPGARSITMTSGSSMVVLTGTVVDIGDANTVEILSRHLRSTSSAGPGSATDDGPGLPPMPRTTTESDQP